MKTVFRPSSGAATLCRMPASPTPVVEPLRMVTATRYVTPLREGGSLPGLVEADDDGLYVLKFSGAGQGPKALIAEVVAGELARALGLPVPELVLVQVDPAFGAAEPDPEIQQLLERSPGVNLGLDFLPGALAFGPAADPELDPELAADIVWFDALVTNVDRTPRNVNLLVWHRRTWLIDHGAALYVQHTWRDPAAHAIRSFGEIGGHVLLPYASSIVAADARLEPRISRSLLEAIVDQVPDAWLAGEPAFSDVHAARAAYVDYLARRLAPPRAFVAAAEDARLARHAGAA
jgi:hypothetical protein